MFIQVLVLQKNNDVYMDAGISPGTLQLVPTPESGGLVDSDYWAVPVTDGIVSSFQYIPTSPNDLVKPDPQAIHVVRISSSKTRDDWYVVGNSLQYQFASKDAECCESPAFTMPSSTPNVVPCQNICSNAAGAFIAYLGLPTLGAGQAYFPQGYLNGVALTGASAAGYATTGALLTFLNANWLNGNLAATWAVSGDSLTLTNTLSGGDDNDPDVLCAQVFVITP